MRKHQQRTAAAVNIIVVALLVAATSAVATTERASIMALIQETGMSSAEVAGVQNQLGNTCSTKNVVVPVHITPLPSCGLGCDPELMLSPQERMARHLEAMEQRQRLINLFERECLHRQIEENTQRARAFEQAADSIRSRFLDLEQQKRDTLQILTQDKAGLDAVEQREAQQLRKVQSEELKELKSDSIREMVAEEKMKKTRLSAFARNLHRQKILDAQNERRERTQQQDIQEEKQKRAEEHTKIMEARTFEMKAQIAARAQAQSMSEQQVKLTKSTMSEKATKRNLQLNIKTYEHQKTLSTELQKATQSEAATKKRLKKVMKKTFKARPSKDLRKAVDKMTDRVRRESKKMQRLKRMERDEKKAARRRRRRRRSSRRGGDQKPNGKPGATGGPSDVKKKKWGKLTQEKLRRFDEKLKPHAVPKMVPRQPTPRGGDPEAAMRRKQGIPDKWAPLIVDKLMAPNGRQIARAAKPSKPVTPHIGGGGQKKPSPVVSGGGGGGGGTNIIVKLGKNGVPQVTKQAAKPASPAGSRRRSRRRRSSRRSNRRRSARRRRAASRKKKPNGKKKPSQKKKTNGRKKQKKRSSRRRSRGRDRRRRRRRRSNDSENDRMDFREVPGFHESSGPEALVYNIDGQAVPPPIHSSGGTHIVQRLDEEAERAASELQQ